MHSSLRWLAAVTALGIAASCSSNEGGTNANDVPATGAMGGAGASGGSTSNAGGTTASGGANGTGGADASGGSSTNTGGTVASGGTSGSGGANGSGANGSGASGSGGAAGDSGTGGSGGTPSTPGRVLSAGTYHSLGIIDGVARAWGSNRAGEMGLGTNAPEVHATPVAISAISDVVAFAAGGYQSLALTSAGKIWSFGANEAGQRGDGSPASDLNGNGTPVLLGLTKVVAVASGGRHNLALTSEGKVYAWGANDNGQLGLGGAVLTSQCGGAVGSTAEAYRKHEPMLVPIDAKLVKIAAGYCFSIALDDTGHVWTWGFGDYQNANLGRGNGTSEQWSTPAMIPNLSGVEAISAGDSCAFALQDDGKVASWGVNREGCVGDGSQSVRSAPVTLSLTNVVAIEARAQGAYAILEDGSLWSWGESMYGSVGDGTFADKAKLDSPDRVYVTSPVRIEDWNDVSSVHSGPASNHAFAVRANGSVYSWGRNKSGNLGNGKVGDSDSTNQTPDDENVAEPEEVEL